jgi:ketopantoate reductase
VTPPTDVNPHEAANRYRKASKLADVARRAGLDSKHANDMDREWWEKAAMVAQVNPPSWLTIRQVIEILVEREDADAIFDKFAREDADGAGWPEDSEWHKPRSLG